ncbi:MAG TPA: hypothetical protein VGE18_02000, partial [Candidatus Paceibacterota bacterium]
MLVISPGIRNLLSAHKRTLFAVVFVFLYSVSITLAVPPSTKYAPGETLDPTCSPGDTNCSVQILSEQTGNAGKLLTTDGNQTSWTDTLSDITFSNAPTFSSYTPGSVPFIGTDGILSESTGLTFDDSTDSLTIGGNSVINGTLTVNSDAFFNGDVTIGNDSTDTLIFNATLASSLLLSENQTFDIGSPSFLLRNIYVDTITANSISAGNSDISGTISGNFTFNSDNLSNDAEDITLIFDRGLQPNALFTWNSTDDRFEFDQDVAVTTLGAGVVRSSAAGLLSSDATTTDLPEGSNLYYTDDRARESLSSSATGLTYTDSTGVFSLTSGYMIPTTTQESNWTTAFNNSPVSLAFDTATGDFTLTQQDAGVLTENLDGRYALSTDLTTAVSGTTNYVAKFTGANSLGNSLIFDNGTNVGIGDTTPAALFTVGSGDLFQVSSVGAIDAVTGITTTGGYTQSGTSANTFTGITTFENAIFEMRDTISGVSGTYFQQAGIDAYIVNQEFTGRLFLGTGNGVKMTMLADGTVGIGTDTPSAKLQVGTTASTTTGLLVYGSDGTSSTTLANFLDNGSNSRFYIRGDGAIGMGTTSPDGSFEVRNASATGIYTTISNTSTGYARTFYKRNSAYSGSIGSDTSGVFGISSGGGTANHLSIDASGNVGINDTTPSAKLDVLATTEQLRLGYDVDTYVSFTVDSAGS